MSGRRIIDMTESELEALLDAAVRRALDARESVTPKVLSAREVGELLGRHPKTINRMARMKQLPGFMVGSAWRFDRAEIEAWLAAQARKGAA